MACESDDKKPTMRYPLQSNVYVLVVCSVLLAGCWSGGSDRAASRPDSSAEVLFAQQRAVELNGRGEALKREGFLAQALNLFTEAAKENPRLTEAHLNIGTIFRERALYDQADQAYRKAVISDPNNFDARYLLGLTNHLKGDLPQAISSYKRALIIDRNSFVANRDMGAAVLQSGRPGEAIEFAKRAVELSPESQASWANLAAAYSLTGDFENAVAAYRQTLALGEPAIPVLLGLADAHLSLGNFQRAENVLRAIERDTGSPIARERLGLALFRQSQFEEASLAYRSVLTDNPGDTASLNGLGISLMAIYLRDGEEDDRLRVEALSLWRRSLSLRPEQGPVIDLISRYTEE